jgi:hypothetical protein
MEPTGGPEQSQDPQIPSSPESAPEAASDAERSEASRSWFEGVRARLRGTPGPGRDEAPDQPAPGQPPEWRPPTNAEEERRRFQSQRDREAAEERRRQYQTDQQQRAAQVAQLEQQKRELLSSHEDWEVGEEVASLERQIVAVRDGTAQESREGSLIGTITATYDSIYGDNYLQELPRAEQERIAREVWQGPEGRAALANEIKGALKKHWTTEGARAERLRMEKNPSVRKQLAHEWGLAHEEPDLVAEATGGNGGSSPDMNSFLRRSFGR